VESAVNQIVSKRFSKKQRMQWTKKGAHLVLQMRTQVLDERLEDTFRDWYPDFRKKTLTTRSSRRLKHPDFYALLYWRTGEKVDKFSSYLAVGRNPSASYFLQKLGCFVVDRFECLRFAGRQSALGTLLR
jgi:hypothetical protein